MTTTTIVSIPMAYKYSGCDAYIFTVSCEIHRNPRSRDQQPRRADALQTVYGLDDRSADRWHLYNNRGENKYGH